MEFSRCFVHQVARCKFMSSFQLKSIFFTICWLGQMCSRLKLFSFLWRIWEWQIWSPIWLIHSRPSEWFQGKLVSDIFVVFSLYSKLILVKNLQFFLQYTFPKWGWWWRGAGSKANWRNQLLSRAMSTLQRINQEGLIVIFGSYHATAKFNCCNGSLFWRRAS